MLLKLSQLKGEINGDKQKGRVVGNFLRKLQDQNTGDVDLKHTVTGRKSNISGTDVGKLAYLATRKKRYFAPFCFHFLCKV